MKFLNFFECYFVYNVHELSFVIKHNILKFAWSMNKGIRSFE